MEPARIIEKAFDDAQLLIDEYIRPGPRDAERTLEQLIDILDDPNLYGALVELLVAERPSLVPV
jgi:hypothetical protein